MAFLCPNKSHPDYVYAVEKLGEDKTLYLYDLLGQEIPTKEQVDVSLNGRKEPNIYNKQQVIEYILSEFDTDVKEVMRTEFASMDKDAFNDSVKEAGFNSLGKYWTLSTVQGFSRKEDETKEQFIARMNSRIENGMYKERSGKLVPITDSFNPEVWWVENSEGLVNGIDKDGRNEVLFNFKNADNRAIELNTDPQYKKKFKFEKDIVIRPGIKVAKSKNPTSNRRLIYRIKVTQLSQPIINEVSISKEFIIDKDINSAIKETYQLVEEAFKALENKTVDESIDIINDLEISEEYKTLLYFFADKLVDNPTLKVEVDNVRTDRLGFYDPNTNTITLYAKAHLTGKVAIDLDQIANTFTHELIHAFTARAFFNNFTDAEKEFVDTIKRLYRIAKKQTKYGKLVGYSSEMEWLARILTDPMYMVEVKKMEINVWDRIISAFKKLFGINTTVYDHALKTVLEYIGTTTDFKVDSKRMLPGLLRSLDEDVYLNKENVTHKEIWEKLNNFSNQFDFNEVDHTYLHIKSNQLFNATTEMLQRLRITTGKLSDDAEIAKTQLEKRARGGNIGSVIHGISEANLKQTAIDIAKANGYSYEPIVVDQIEQILKQFKRPGVTILSEVLVADIDILLAGTIDMIVIDENNNVHIYDFKSKERGFTDYLKKTKFGGSQLMSDKERHAFQVSAYKDMFEKITGLNVASLNIVQLKPTIIGSTITNISLDKTQSPTGIVQVDYNYGVTRMYSRLKRTLGITPINEFDQDKVDPETRTELDEEIKSKLEQAKSNLSELTNKEKIVYKSIDALIHKIQVIYRSGKKHEIATQEKLIEELTTLITNGEVEKSLVKILKYANSSAIRIWAEYQKYKEEGKELPLTVLYGWRDSVSAFNAILNDEDGLNSVLSDEFGFQGGPEYRGLLKNTIEIVSKIKGLYEAEGLEQLVDFLSPFYNELYAELRLAKVKEYRRKKFKGEISTDISEEQYVDKSIDENEEDLQKRTKTLIRKELKKASKDIGVLTRWIDNLLDSTDPVTAAMVKAFVFADEEARIGGLENRDEMVSMVRKVEDWYKQTGRIPKSNEEFYDFMLEKIDGKRTGNYITSYTSEMMREYRDIISTTRGKDFFDEKELNKIPKDQQAEYIKEVRKDYINSWLDENMPLQKDAFSNAYWDFIEQQYALGKISDQEYKNLDDNRTYKNKLSVQEMTEKGIITFEVGDILGTWLSENTWDYRVPTEKWANPQYTNLLKILDNPNDARGEFYKYVVKLRREADSMLPFGFRLDTRLPGVIKQNHERTASGQGIGATIRGALSRQLTFQVDDTNRIHEEIIDESNNARYFLPIHFTGRITKEVTKVNSEGESYTVREFDEDEQSFDIATIYHKYWTMANDYNTKKEILPEMEMAKFMINKRKAIKRDSIGNKLLRKKNKRSRVSGGPEEGEVLVNNTLLAEQVNDWFLSCVYGIEEKDAGQWGKIDIGKLLNFVNSYVSLNLLGLNVVAGTANVILGETLQRIESFAHEYMSSTDFFYADKFYLRTMKGMISDIGARDVTGLGTHIIEQFGIFDDYGESDMDRRSKAGQMLNMDTVYFTSHLGEQYMQSRFLFGLLANKRALNSKGEDIGRMLDMYELKDNKLVIKPEVDLVKSKWTDGSNGSKDYQGDFKLKVRGILSRLHGEYGKLGKVAIQRMAIGRMAYLFRHFVVPGFRRRWGKKAYIERLGQFVEGNYITTFKFLGASGSKIFGKTEENKEEAFFSRLIGNLQSLKLTMFSEEWASLTDHEKANVHRTLYEVGFLILAVVLANIAMSFKGDADDDDDKFAQMYWSFIAYQTYRLQNELLFFTPKLDSAMSILRSPAASMSFIENLISLSGQIFHPTDVYESGPWKGRPKIIKTLNNMAPGVRQFYRLKDIEVQIPWMQKSSLSGKPEQGEDQYITPTYTVPPSN